MPIRKPKPTSPGMRFVSYPDFAEITKSEPEKTLIEGLKKSGGRNAHGRKTSRHGDGADIATGNCMELARMPVGTVVHNVELSPGRGGQLARSAGASVQLMAKDGEMATLRLPSGEMRLVRAECRATVGVIGNADHQNVKVGKAGRSATRG